MAQIPILEAIMKYIGENNVPFSMPGHKSGKGFLETREGKLLYENLIKGDITEVDGMDNLHHAEGVIKDAQERLSHLYRSRKSYFLVNGSTSGNMTMIFSSFNEGDTVIVERNCHRSIFNAIIMRKLKPLYIRNKISKNFNAPFSIDMEHFFQLIQEHREAKGIIITYPNYYGVCVDLKKIIREVKRHNMKVLVDSAHGAHFGISPELPESALILGADMVVMSAHKTLPSLTQTAYLHVNDNVDLARVDFYMSAFTSTSPSYMFLATLDYARFYLEVKGKSAFEECIRLANKYREKINCLKDFHVISQDDVSKCEPNDKLRIDESRYIINVKKGLSGHKLLKYLRTMKIQAEMSDASNVVLIFSPFNDEGDFKKLLEALERCPLEQIKDDSIEYILNRIPQTVLMPYEALNKNTAKLPLMEAAGKVSAVNIVPYPPGIPILMLGERIEEEALNVIKYYMDNGITVLGIEDNHIYIIVGERSFSN